MHVLRAHISQHTCSPAVSMATSVSVVRAWSADAAPRASSTAAGSDRGGGRGSSAEAPSLRAAACCCATKAAALSSTGRSAASRASCVSGKERWDVRSKLATAFGPKSVAHCWHYASRTHLAALPQVHPAGAVRLEACPAAVA